MLTTKLHPHLQIAKLLALLKLLIPPYNLQWIDVPPGYFPTNRKCFSKKGIIKIITDIQGKHWQVCQKPSGSIACVFKTLAQTGDCSRHFCTFFLSFCLQLVTFSSCPSFVSTSITQIQYFQAPLNRFLHFLLEAKNCSGKSRRLQTVQQKGTYSSLQKMIPNTTMC